MRLIALLTLLLCLATVCKLPNGAGPPGPTGASGAPGSTSAAPTPGVGEAVSGERASALVYSDFFSGIYLWSAGSGASSAVDLRLGGPRGGLVVWRGQADSRMALCEVLFERHLRLEPQLWLVGGPGQEPVRVPLLPPRRAQWTLSPDGALLGASHLLDEATGAQVVSVWSTAGRLVGRRREIDPGTRCRIVGWCGRTLVYWVRWASTSQCWLVGVRAEAGELLERWRVALPDLAAHSGIVVIPQGAGCVVYAVLDAPVFTATNRVRVWRIDPVTGSILREDIVEVVTDRVTLICDVSPDGNRILVQASAGGPGYEGEGVGEVPLAAGRQPLRLLTGQPLWKSCYSADGGVVAGVLLVAGGHVLVAIDVATGVRLGSVRLPDPARVSFTWLGGGTPGDAGPGAPTLRGSAREPE